ncbi:hypothetical protein J6590_026427 [Homalodisca vitripennis]|nr:hypothetical protein J6590_026427 [Homalodisca vitripennis]
MRHPQSSIGKRWEWAYDKCTMGRPFAPLGRPLAVSARVYRPALDCQCPCLSPGLWSPVPVTTARPLVASARVYRSALGRQCPLLPPGLWSPVPVSTARPLVASARVYRPAFGRQCP